jgi:RES domain-containing protein
MLAYRLVKAKHALDAFTGEAARRYGGRWNRPGIPMVYAAQSRALAAQETLVHFGGEERNIDFVVYEVDVPDDLLLRLRVEDLPRDWRNSIPADSTQELGSAWQMALSSPALAVPSVLVPEEYCVLLNPLHPDTRRITVSFPIPFEFDGRL